MTVTNKTGDAALLKFLLQAELITGDLAAVATRELAGSESGSLIDWIVRNGLIDEEALARTLAARLQLPYVNLAALALDPAVTSMVKEDLVTRFGVVPLRAPEGGLVVAIANPLDREALRAVEFAVGRRVHAEVATSTAIRDTIEHAYHLEKALDAYLKGVPESGDVPVAELEDEGTDLKTLMRESTLPPVIKLFNLIVVDAIRAGASDVHIEPHETGVRVRFRIDGILEESFRLPKWIQAPLIARCKVVARLDITERRVPQDGRIRLNYRESMVDLRVSSLPTQFGEKVTLRLLDPTRAPAGLDQFGFSARDLACIRQAIARPDGMILVTGPTGSGKTTTLYGMLAEMISPESNIVTIENPIEYQIRGVNQVEVNEKQGLTFAGTLRSILRQDPDVILIGEIRDHETADIALRAAQTGHLVLSTLHTNDAASAVTRLIDIGIEPYMLASSLHLIVAQRLVRRTCRQCAAPFEPDDAQLRALQVDTGRHTFRRGNGCPACRKTGYAGRAGVFEVLPISPAVAKLIDGKVSESALRAQARDGGMSPLAEQAVAMVCAGLTTPEEVLRVVDVLDGGARCPSCGHGVEDTFSLCPRCAVPLHATCAGCGAQLQQGWQICPYCGVAPQPRPAPVHTVSLLPPPRRELPAPLAPRQFRALVVDDTADFRQLITRTLERGDLPVSVTAVGNGVEALEHAEHDPPDFILLDVMMPEMDGFEVCRRLRANVRTAFIPILMLTALDDAGSRTRGFLAGTDDYIGKPFARADLLARVRRLLQRSYGASFQEAVPAATAA